MDSSTAQGLKVLFDFVPPQELRKSLTKLFFNALDTMDEIPEDFHKVAQDTHALIRFLDKAAKDKN